MDKYLFTTLPSNDLGLLTRSLPIARELHDLGNKIVFCNPAKAPKKLISYAGFQNMIPNQPVYQILASDSILKTVTRLFRSPHLFRDFGILFSLLKGMEESSTDKIRNIDHFMYLFGMWNRKFIQANVEALIEVISEYHPDYIIDFWNPFACIAARISEVTLITVIQADMHPKSQGFMWWDNTDSSDYPSCLPAINEVLGEFNLSTVNKVSELLVGDLTLVVGIPGLDPLPEDAEVKYIGPILWQKEEDTLPERLSSIRNRQPLIWLYPGNIKYISNTDTPYDSQIVLDTCIEALKETEVQILLTTGHHQLPKAYHPLPENFYFEPYVPGLKMAEKSDLLIHHGGYGSCQTGLYTGTPALIIPTYTERESNARRIADKKAGEYVLPTSNEKGQKKRVDVEEVRTNVFKILSDPTYTENAKKISQKMREYGGASQAAQIIEKFCA